MTFRNVLIHLYREFFQAAMQVIRFFSRSLRKVVREGIILKKWCSHERRKKAIFGRSLCFRKTRISLYTHKPGSFCNLAHKADRRVWWLIYTPVQQSRFDSGTNVTNVTSRDHNRISSVINLWCTFIVHSPCPYFRSSVAQILSSNSVNIQHVAILFQSQRSVVFFFMLLG